MAEPIKPVETIEFTTELFRETSFSRESMGVCKNEMNLYIWTEKDDPDAKGSIEWVYNVGKDNEDAVEIGVWFEKKRLVDYDGVFELPKQAIKLLNKAGFVVPKEFRS